MKQTLTRKQLITLHSQFTCTEWKTAIEELLKENVLKDKIDVSSKLELLKTKGTEEQQEAVKKLKITFSKSYLELHNESGLKVGDKVKVVRKATNREQGWDNSWTTDMDVCVGNYYEINYDGEHTGFALNCIGNFNFPYFVLEKVEEKYVPYTLEDAEKLIGKSIKSKDGSVFCSIVYISENEVYRGDRFRINFLELLNNWTELDGSPLGKLTETY